MPSHHSSPGLPLRFRGGLTGALTPFLLFLAGVAWLGLSGAPDERGFWPILLLALGVGTWLARDRNAYGDAVLSGMAQPVVALMILAWMLAGVLAAVLQASGFVQALLALAQAVGLSGGLFTVTCYLLAAALATATGTSLGTLILAVPLLYPNAAALGASPVWTLAAILGGATFGDNISPVSDTTIASATTQHAPMGTVVRTRLRYALPAAAATLLTLFFVGGAPEAGAAGELGSANLLGLAAGLGPALAIALLIRGRPLVVGLFAGVAATIAAALLLGLVAPSELIYLDLESFVARGLLLDGMERAIGVSVFTLLLMGLSGGIERAGILDRIFDVARRQARTAASAERWIVTTTSAFVLLTTHSAVTILALGEPVRKLGERFGIAATRRANLLDVTVCTYPFLLPYFIPTVLAASLSATGAEAGLPTLSAWEIGVRNVHSWVLLALVVFAVLSGWGRSSESEQVQ